MAKLHNEQARRKVEENYNGRWNEGVLFDLEDMENVDVSWEFYDTCEKAWIVQDGHRIGKTVW